MKRVTIVLFLAMHLSFANTVIWSKTGHRVVGSVAQKHLSRKAKKAIDKLLDGQSLAAVSNFADEIKADRSFRKFNAWHYVNFPLYAKYGDETPSEYGDVITGIEKCIEIIKNETSSRADKAFYLKMLVHLVGDLHQPMHVGRLADKGGNDIQVVWFGRGSNLHKVWDLNLIEDHGMSYTELASSLPRLSKPRIKAMQQGDIYDWVEESQDIASKLYESVQVGEKLGYRYRYVWWDTVEAQLQKGGVRLAAVLNRIYE
ncbi:S1/P1 nuclease [Costertonia aggregata]|uniref:S1/P1 nuclease n=1 Tax=Costertonia aggregata TaxID=343403 RepID=A0A7H9ALD6_9FLAO|nr:S1/P1 nuclease [Costertonia aggregata]QLG44217.1 S1/P1 nuclease [Costertonia aggregata]